MAEDQKPNVTQTLDVNQKQKVRYCIDEWLKNEQIKIAISTVKDRIQPSNELNDEPIAIVGFGPSLKKTWKKIKKFKYIISCSGAHKFLLERGVIPTWDVIVDPRVHKIELMGPPNKDVTYLAASTCHPKLWEHLKDFNVKLWHVFDNSEEAARILPRGEWAITGGCDAGLRCMTIARFFGFRNLHIFGLDGSSPDPEAGRHADYHPNKVKATNPVKYEGKTFYTTPSMLEAARSVWHELDMLKDVNAKFYGEGLIQHMAKFYKKKPDDGIASPIAFAPDVLITEEYKKLNTQLHKDNLAYGVGGGKHAAVVKKLVEANKFKSVLDFGAGKGMLQAALDFPIFQFDPAIPEISAIPRPAELTVCFPEKTVIGGSSKYIEDIKVGDIVSNSNGEDQLVTKTFCHKYKGDLVTLKIGTTPDLDITAEHPVLVFKMKRIHRKNNISYEKSSYEKVAFDPVWKEAKNVCKGDWLAIPRRQFEENYSFSFAKNRGKNKINVIVDEEVAWLFGLYVAEGFTSYFKNGGGKLTLCLGSHEEELAQKAVDIFRKIGVTASINRTNVKHSSLTVNMCIVEFCEFFDIHCGKHAKNKIIPDFIKNSGENIIRSFLKGLIDGDGCLRASNQPGNKGIYEYYSIVTVSKKLAYQVLELLHKIGIYAYLPNPNIRGVTLIQGRLCNTLPSYTILWSKRSWDNQPNKDGKVPYGASYYIGNYVYVPVKSITTKPVEDLLVYNIETEDHTYNVPYIVHNCTDVLEHIEPELLDNVLRELKRCTLNLGYFVIHSGPSSKFLADGRNSHLIQKGPEWWRQKLEKFFFIPENGIIYKKPLIYAIVSPKIKKIKPERIIESEIREAELV